MAGRQIVSCVRWLVAPVGCAERRIISLVGTDAVLAQLECEGPFAIENVCARPKQGVCLGETHVLHALRLR